MCIAGSSFRPHGNSPSVRHYIQALSDPYHAHKFTLHQHYTIPYPICQPPAQNLPSRSAQNLPSRSAQSLRSRSRCRSLTLTLYALCRWCSFANIRHGQQSCYFLQPPTRPLTGRLTAGLSRFSGSVFYPTPRACFSQIYFTLTQAAHGNQF